jgi:hypothetical protein
VKSDAEGACMRGHIARILETFHDHSGDAAVLPDTLGEHDTHTVIDYKYRTPITFTTAADTSKWRLTACPTRRCL